MTDRSDVETAVLNACIDDGGMAVVDLILSLMMPGVALDWLGGCNGHLGSAQPIVVLQLEGAAPVIDALRAFEQGSFS